MISYFSIIRQCYSSSRMSPSSILQRFKIHKTLIWPLPPSTQISDWLSPTSNCKAVHEQSEHSYILRSVMHQNQRTRKTSTISVSISSTIPPSSLQAKGSNGLLDGYSKANQEYVLFPILLWPALLPLFKVDFSTYRDQLDCQIYLRVTDRTKQHSSYDLLNVLMVQVLIVLETCLIVM